MKVALGSELNQFATESALPLDPLYFLLISFRVRQ